MLNVSEVVQCEIAGEGELCSQDPDCSRAATEGSLLFVDCLVGAVGGSLAGLHMFAYHRHTPWAPRGLRIRLGTDAEVPDPTEQLESYHMRMSELVPEHYTSLVAEIASPTPAASS